MSIILREKKLFFPCNLEVEMSQRRQSAQKALLSKGSKTQTSRRSSGQGRESTTEKGGGWGASWCNANSVTSHLPPTEVSTPQIPDTTQPSTNHTALDSAISGGNLQHMYHQPCGSGENLVYNPVLEATPKSQPWVILSSQVDLPPEHPSPSRTSPAEFLTNEQNNPEIYDTKPVDGVEGQEPFKPSRKPPSEAKKMTRRIEELPPSCRYKRKQANVKQTPSKPMQKLNVLIRFSKLFESYHEVEQIIATRLQQLQNEDYKVQLDTDILVHNVFKSRETNCNFVITTSNILETQRLMENIVFNLREEFGVNIGATFMNYDSMPKRSENMEIKSGAINIEDKTSSQDRNKNYVFSSELPTKKKKPPVVHKKGTKSVPCVSAPQRLQVNVGRHYESPYLFLQFLQTSLLNGLSMSHVIRESILVSGSSASCVIETDSRAESRRLRKAVLELAAQRTNLKLTLSIPNHSVGSKTHKKETLPRKQISQTENKVAETLSKINIAKQETLKRHSEQISHFQDELASMKVYFNNFQMSSVGTILAVQERLEQLKNQKSELSDRINVLSQGLLNRYPTQVEDWDMANVLKAVVIECSRLEKAHPVYAWRRVILEQLKAKRICVVVGMPGSGKSTQLPQYLFEAGYANEHIIVCTQPRKSAVAGISEKVAKDLDTKVGDLVGYRTESSSTESENRTKILFMTEISLLNECLHDPDFKKYSCIVLDEAQERTIYTDVLIGIIKGCLKKCKNLHVVISTSSEEQSRLFADYFNIFQIIRVSKGAFPVHTFYEDKSENFENHEMKAVLTAADIHCNGNPGDILIFLNSPDEIIRCCNKFESCFPDQTNFKCLAFHEHLSEEDLKKPFESVPSGVRKIIFASDYAESSAPLENIKFVIDTGITKERNFDPIRHLRISGTRAISKISALRRANTAGWDLGGKCYRLYSKDDFDSFADDDVPEILRTNLAAYVLKLVELGIQMSSFNFLQAPDEFALDSALHRLNIVGAIENGAITESGRWLSTLPYDITNNHLILRANEHNLTYDAVVLSTLIYYSDELDLYYQSLSDANSNNQASNLARDSSPLGDAFTSLDIYKTWSGLSRDQKANWCQRKRINYKSLNFLCQHVEDTLTILKEKLAIDVVRIFCNRSRDLFRLRKIIFQANILSVSHFTDQGETGYKSLLSQHVVPVHHKSIFAESVICPEWIVFTELVRTCKEYMIRGITIVEETWVQEEVESCNLKVDKGAIKRSLVYHGEFGAQVFDRVVGPGCRFLLELQRDHAVSLEKSYKIETDTDFGTLDIYSYCDIDPSIIERLERPKSLAVMELQSEECEFDISFEKNLTWNTIKIVVGEGGYLKKAVTPALSNQIIVTKAPRRANVQKILARFNKSGHDRIVDVEKFRGKTKNWGIITFQSVSQAISAAMSTGEDEIYSAEIQLNRSERYTPNLFETTVTWLNERPWHSCPEANLKILVDKKKSLASLLKNHVMETQFQIQMPLLLQTDNTCVGFVYFTDPVQGERVCREMNQSYKIDGQEIQFSFSYGTVLRIPRLVKAVCQKELSCIIDSLTQTYDGLCIAWKQLGEDFAIEIKCSKPEPVQDASAQLCRELQGEIVDCSTNAKWECLLNRWGKNFLDSVQQTTGCVAITDTRNSKIHLYGAKSKIKYATEEINACLSDHQEVTSFNLKRSDMTMYVLHKFGPNFDDLVENCGLRLAKLDLLTNSLLVVGSRTAVEKTVHHMMELENELNEVKLKQREIIAPVCSMCKGLAVKGSCHRLEICSHLYCFSCLRSVTELILKNTTLPLACIHDVCRAKFVTADVIFLLSRNLICKKDLTIAALRVFMSTEDGRFSFCPSINCHAFYKVTYEFMGFEFACPVCLASTCTSCHKPFHRGLPCDHPRTSAKAFSLDTALSRSSDHSLSLQKVFTWISKISWDL